MLYEYGSCIMCTGGRKHSIKALPCSKHHSIYLFNLQEIFILKGDKTYEKMCNVKTLEVAIDNRLSIAKSLNDINVIKQEFL